VPTPPADTRRVLNPTAALRRRWVKCLHVLSSFQRTGLPCLARIGLAPGVRQAPLQLYFLQGNLSILQSGCLAVNPFSLYRVDFFRGARDRRPHAHAPPFPVFRAPGSATWDCELKEVGRLSALAPRQSSSVQPIYAALPRTVNSGMRPKTELIRTCVTDWLVEL
jgi:hypothetical protein